jgi:hypothetical protein
MKKQAFDVHVCLTGERLSLQRRVVKTAPETLVANPGGVTLGFAV